MSLFKKTIVITNDKTLGYASIIAIGSTIGIKVAIKDCEPSMHAVVKLKDTPYFFDMDSNTLEAEVKSQPLESDEICVLILKDNTIIGRGGRKDKALELEAQAKYTEVTFSPVADTDNNITEPQTEESKTQSFDFFAPQTDKNFYLGIIDKMDEMMTIYPPDDTLNGLIEGGQFVRVQYDDNESYSVGTITVDGKVEYIVYAVEGLQDVLPPDETRDVADFVPTGEDGHGYWVIMQSAVTGEAVKVE